MCGQRPRRQLRRALQTADPFPFPLPPPKRWSHPHHLPRICRLRVPVSHVIWLAYHPCRLVDIGLEPKPVKQPCQDTQRRLQAGRSGRGEEPVVGVKERHQPLDRLSEPFWFHLLSRDQRNPVTNHCIHHHVEDGGGEGISLGDPPVALLFLIQSST